MRARSQGAVVVIVVGLVLAVALPAGARASSAPAQEMVTAVARTSHLTMKSGFSKYLFVGGSSAQAANSQTTFAHFGNILCGPPPSEGPMGPSTKGGARGSFHTSGDVSAIAGVGISGYSVKRLISDQDDQVCRSSTTRVPWGNGLNFAVPNVGGIVVFLVGTDGVGYLAPTLDPYEGGLCQTTDGLYPATLQNVTVSKGQDDGTTVAVFSASLHAGDSCDFDVEGTSYNNVSQGFGIWFSAYLLVPKK